jgi:cephalosporin hydroxylase
LLDILGRGEVITIDVEDEFPRPTHPRITYVKGSSVDEPLIEDLLRSRPVETRLIVLDSVHTKQHVLNELNLLARHVSLGSYMIVEDTNVNGHPAYESFGEGPQEAVNEFLETNDNFVVDESREKFLMTFNPRGYLKRVRL